MTVSMYGGVFGVMPSFIAELFGSKYAGGIHGRCIPAWSTASLVGPNALAYLRQTRYDEVVVDLATKVDSAAFETKFGAPIAELPVLMQSKAVTIGRLMDIAPPGTLDP